MESYTIEDIELLRKKSGLSYQEAVALLDYHSGNLARALIDLEKNGRLKESDPYTGSSDERASDNKGKYSKNKEQALNILQKLYRCRLKISKDNTNVVNISPIFGVACLIFAPHMTIIGIILSMILGYKFSFSRNDEAFASDSLEKMVKSAAQNAKSSVSSVVQSFSDSKDGRNTGDTGASKAAQKDVVEKPAASEKAPSTGKVEFEDPAESLKKQAKEIEETMDSFFESNPAATTYRSAYSAAASSVPTIQIPVQAETKEGTVQVNDEQDGYSTVTIG